MKRRNFLKLIGYSPLAFLIPKILIKGKPLPEIAKKRVGAYMGNATHCESIQVIHGIGFQPKYIEIYNNSL